MDYRVKLKEENEAMRERFDLAVERIRSIPEEHTVKEPFVTYFHKVSQYILKMVDVFHAIEDGSYEKKSLVELQAWNKDLYEDLSGENYESSYANPAYACEILGEDYGKVLTCIYARLRASLAGAFEYRLFDLTVNMELFIEIYNLFEEEDETTYKEIKSALYYTATDYSEEVCYHRTRELLDPELSFLVDIVMNSDLSDLRYLYQYGDRITDTELKTAEFLNGLSQEKIDAMASTYTEGYRIGFGLAGIDLSKKGIVNVRYEIGFERMVRAAIKQFEKMGLKPTIRRSGSNKFNKQYDYDHRFDYALYFDKGYIEKRLAHLRKGYDAFKEQASLFAGPAVIETFGEKPFTPVSKPECNKLNDKQQKLDVEFSRDSRLLMNEYIKGDEYSFTIIAYPVPDIGEQFEEIFEETVKVNTLDYNLYKEIQQKLIDTLDSGEYVHIQGSGVNKTDLNVQLHEIPDKKTQTGFENCLADVNIPVGEVFTSPKLTGTNGILHVSEVYLNDYKYIDLELTMKDGKIAEYTCKNFDSEEENKKFIKENLLFNHETLPMGEFAIGTNTTAYMMGRKYNIQDKLPILIAEKTGPHFAMGDTCYSMSEEMVTRNPDGKEIIAKDNECSILRKTDLALAYFNCHTDITIPYDELGEIAVYTKDGQKIVLIENGRFVLEGTEELNRPFDE
ncbi:aminopeptidase [Anaerosporobacter faecicola]|uniref:aminopeptidase n=1 Tax=Anaerosporobacter faecicola TaxID=2718714 RepID=UPI00143AD626|nr:aminopeptidase [Anaerosporobacter faecicola]